MLLDADKPVPPRPPIDWRWMSQWPWLLQALPLLLVWFLGTLGQNGHPYWEHVAFAILTVWTFWANWDVLSNQDNPYHLGHTRTRRITHVVIGFALWLGFAIWYVWSHLAVGPPAAN